MKLRAVHAQRSEARADNLHCDRREVEAEADPWHLRQCIDMAQPTASTDHVCFLQRRVRFGPRRLWVDCWWLTVLCVRVGVFVCVRIFRCEGRSCLHGGGARGSHADATRTGTYAPKGNIHTSARLRFGTIASAGRLAAAEYVRLGRTWAERASARCAGSTRS